MYMLKLKIDLKFQKMLPLVAVGSCITVGPFPEISTAELYRDRVVTHTVRKHPGIPHLLTTIMAWRCCVLISSG